MSPKPLYETAADLLEELAKPLCKRAMRAPEDSRAAEECFEAWYTLRSIAGRMRCTKSISLSAQNRADMDAALDLVHELAHDLDPKGMCACLKECTVMEAVCIVALCEVLKSYENQMGGSNAA